MDFSYFGHFGGRGRCDDVLGLTEAEAVISGALGGGYYRIKKIKKGNFLLHFFQKAGFFFIFNFLILAVIDKHGNVISWWSGGLVEF